MFLHEGAQLKRLNNAASAAQTALGSTFARAGFDRCLIFAALGDVTDTSVLGLAVSSGNESNGSDAVAISGASTAFTAGATSADNGLLAVDVALGDKDYITWALTRTTANAVVDGVFALLYHSRSLPVSQSNLLATIGKGVAV